MIFKPSVLSLQQKSTNVLSVFAQTIQQLTDVNKTAVKERENRLKLVSLYNKEAEDLKQLTEDNTSVISNINNLLSKRQTDERQDSKTKK